MYICLVLEVLPLLEEPRVVEDEGGRRDLETHGKGGLRASFVWGSDSKFANYNFRKKPSTGYKKKHSLPEGWNSRVWFETQGLFESIVKPPYESNIT